MQNLSARGPCAPVAPKGERDFDNNSPVAAVPQIDLATKHGETSGSHAAAILPEHAPPERLALNRVYGDSRLQMRELPHAEEYIAALAEHIKAGGAIEPIVVCEDSSTGDYLIADGNARAEGCLRAGLRHIEAIVLGGGFQSALKHARAVNDAREMQRTAVTVHDASAEGMPPTEPAAGLGAGVHVRPVTGEVEAVVPERAQSVATEPVVPAAPRKTRAPSEGPFAVGSKVLMTAAGRRTWNGSLPHADLDDLTVVSVDAWQVSVRGRSGRTAHISDRRLLEPTESADAQTATKGGAR